MLISDVFVKFNNKSIVRFKSCDVRVRFAPSPTGFLHLGGLRTALYNFLFAQSTGGKFILRIEDTDQTRFVKGATQALKNDLLWSGIEIDEGPNIGGEFGPYIQSSRLTLYKEQVKVLLQNKAAYYCFCTDKRLDLLRKEAVRNREVPKYDNRCRHLTKDEIHVKLNKGEKYCIRFKLAPGDLSFDDLVYGKISYDISLNEGDPVIIKSDEYPTYHFANVVDDHFMKISHVLRGVEWQISTTKHILLYKAFNWELPKFGHLPLLMNEDGTKLSKRQGDIKISHFRENNIFPLALINFIVQSGGGFKKDLEQNCKPMCYTIQELANQFDVAQIKTHSGKLMSDRLLEFNKLELKRQLRNDESAVVSELQKMLQKELEYVDGVLQLEENYIKKILHWASNRVSKLTDLLSKDLQFVWVVPKTFPLTNDLKVLEEFVKKLEVHDEFCKEELNVILKKYSNDNGLKYSNFMKTLRSILSGLKEGPGVAEMMEILGKENTLYRLKACLNKTKY